jgi:tmRNA-binding protein
MFALYNNFQPYATVAKNSKALADYYITETFTYPLSP